MAELRKTARTNETGREGMSGRGRESRKKQMRGNEAEV